jgi:hypothetical protein
MCNDFFSGDYMRIYLQYAKGNDFTFSFSRDAARECDEKMFIHTPCSAAEERISPSSALLFDCAAEWSVNEWPILQCTPSCVEPLSLQWRLLFSKIIKITIMAVNLELSLAAAAKSD